METTDLSVIRKDNQTVNNFSHIRLLFLQHLVHSKYIQLLLMSNLVNKSELTLNRGK